MAIISSSYSSPPTKDHQLFKDETSSRAARRDDADPLGPSYGNHDFKFLVQARVPPASRSRDPLTLLWGGWLPLASGTRSWSVCSLLHARARYAAWFLRSPTDVQAWPAGRSLPMSQMPVSRHSFASSALLLSQSHNGATCNSVTNPSNRLCPFVVKR